MDGEPFDARAYWEERLGALEGLGGVGEIGLGGTYNEWMYRVRRLAFNRHVAPIARTSRPQHVIDVGSGTGFYVDLWKRLQVPRVTGIDITQVAVERLASRFPGDDFVRADISSPEITQTVKPAQFVSAFDVLFHIVDNDRFHAALDNIATLTEPGGYFVLSDLFQHASRFGVRHQVGRTLDDLVAALDSVGFEVVLRRPVFCFMADPTDSDSRVLRRTYATIARVVRRGAVPAWLAGALVFPLEAAATAVLREGPSIEVMVARKR